MFPDDLVVVALHCATMAKQLTNIGLMPQSDIIDIIFIFVNIQKTQYINFMLGIICEVMQQ